MFNNYSTTVSISDQFIFIIYLILFDFTLLERACQVLQI